MFRLIVIYFSTVSSVISKNPEEFPNIVVFIADDLGIGDIGCYGNTTVRTPFIDKLAAEGSILQQHLSASPICTPSRAAFLTSRYPQRFGISGPPNVILHVTSKPHLPLDEVTIAQVFKTAGYATKIVGKWHVGSHCTYFGAECPGPLKHGFDSHYGLIHSLHASMDENAPFWMFDLTDVNYLSLIVAFFMLLASIQYLWKNKHYVESVAAFPLGVLVLIVLWFLKSHMGLDVSHPIDKYSSWAITNFDLLLFEDGQVVGRKNLLSGEEALAEKLGIHSQKYIEEQTILQKDGGKPFFLVHSFAHPHTPLFASNKNKNRSKCGKYCDNVEEMDDMVGLVHNAVLENKRETGRETIVYFVSDHGGHIESIDEDGIRDGGHNHKFKGGKGMGGAEGGIRVPAIMWYPGKIKEGSQVVIPTSMLDMMPTLAELAGLPPLQELAPDIKELDGVSFASRLTEVGLTEDETQDEKAVAEDRFMLHHCDRSVHAMRLATGNKAYKMHRYQHRWHPGSTQCGWGPTQYCTCMPNNNIDLRGDPLLYEMYSDPYEEHPIDKKSEEYREIVGRMQAYLKKWEKNVEYATPLLSGTGNTMIRLWMQPYCLDC